MIRGRAINLRVIRESDVDTLLDLENDLTRKGDYLPHRLVAESEFRRQLQETGFLTEEAGRLLMVDGEDRIVGSVGYFRPTHYSDGYEVAYKVYEPVRRGRGVATEATSLLIGWLFSTKKISRIQAALSPENAASRKVLERNGFRLEGVMRKAIFMQGRSQDAELWSLLREEWEEAQASRPAVEP